MSDYTFYFSQLDAQAGEGQPPETTPGHPHSGFYRVQRWAPAAKPGGPRTRVYDPVAIWWENGQVYCAKPGFVPTHADEIDQLFSQCCRNAVTEETYRAVVGGAAWPDQVEERAPAERTLIDHYAESVWEQIKEEYADDDYLSRADYEYELARDRLAEGE